MKHHTLLTLGIALILPALPIIAAAQSTNGVSSAGPVPRNSAVSTVIPETKEARNARMAWWIDARYGMFIHWDISSVAGYEISWSRVGSKPLDITGNPAGYVEDPKYDNLYKKFDPEKFDAKVWVKLAKDAGMKYIVFTAKHHGGFCMWTRN